MESVLRHSYPQGNWEGLTRLHIPSHLTPTPPPTLTPHTLTTSLSHPLPPPSLTHEVVRVSGAGREVVRVWGDITPSPPHSLSPHTLTTSLSPLTPSPPPSLTPHHLPLSPMRWWGEVVRVWGDITPSPPHSLSPHTLTTSLSPLTPSPPPSLTTHTLSPHRYILQWV